MQQQPYYQRQPPFIPPHLQGVHDDDDEQPRFLYYQSTPIFQISGFNGFTPPRVPYATFAPLPPDTSSRYSSSWPHHQSEPRTQPLNHNKDLPHPVRTTFTAEHPPTRPRFGSTPHPSGKRHSERRKERVQKEGKKIRSRRNYPPVLVRDPISIFDVPDELHPAMNIWVSLIPRFQGQEKLHGQPMEMTSNRVGALWLMHDVFLTDQHGKMPKERNSREELGVAVETLKIALAPERGDRDGDYLVEMLENALESIEMTLQ